jgi:hypothetical protein
MTQALQAGPTPMDAAIVERVLIHGDLRQLTPAQKVSYYNRVCESVGLNPLTKPFEYIVLNGKETLYAKRDATDQLRKIHNVSVQIVAREVTEDCYVVTARATLPTNRQDESIGAVPISNLRGENRANAMMKCETKAKRRVTLSICGLGMLDETEVDSLNHQLAPLIVTPLPTPTPVTAAPTVAGVQVPPTQSGGDSECRPSGAETAGDAAPSPTSMPPGFELIAEVRSSRAGSVVELVLQSGECHLIYKAQLKTLAEECCQLRIPVQLDLKKSGSGNFYCTGIHKLPPPITDAELDAQAAKESGDGKDLPF